MALDRLLDEGEAEAGPGRQCRLALGAGKNSWKSFPCSSSGIPMPVSRTVKPYLPRRARLDAQLDLAPLRRVPDRVRDEVFEQLGEQLHAAVDRRQPGVTMTREGEAAQARLVLEGAPEPLRELFEVDDDVGDLPAQVPGAAIARSWPIAWSRVRKALVHPLQMPAWAGVTSPRSPPRISSSMLRAAPSGARKLWRYLEHELRALGHQALDRLVGAGVLDR